jgi:hypothetical protein
MKKTTAKQRINSLIKELDRTGNHQIGLLVLEEMIKTGNDIFREEAQKLEKNGLGFGILDTRLIQDVCDIVDRNVKREF